MQGIQPITKLERKGRVRSFFLSGALMTVCSIVLRSIAVSFNVYVANTVGAEAVGLYTLLGGVYGFSLTLALSGINLALTRLVSEALALNDRQKAIAIIKKASFIAITFGSLASLLLYFLAEPISLSWLCDERAKAPLRILSVCLPAVALSSVFNGYFTAVRRAYKNAFSNLCEMAAKISFTAFLFSKTAEKDVGLACIVLVLGTVFSEICSFFINLFLYLFDRSRHLRKTKNGISPKGVSKSILSISLPVALTSYVRSALISVEHSLIPRELSKFGSDKATALSSYGALTGMALPVINFPYALIGSFTSLLIPEVAESHAKHEEKHIRYLAYRTYQSCLSFAFCVGGVFFAFSNALGMLLYSSDEAAEYIRLLAPLVVVMYTDTSTDALLKGLGEEIHCMKVNIADALLSVILVSLLVSEYGILGYVATIYIAELVNVCLSLGHLIRVTKFRFPITKLFIAPLFSSVGAGALSELLLRLFNMPMGILSTSIGIIIYILLYFIIMSIIGAISDEDAAWIRSIFRKEKK